MNYKKLKQKIIEANPEKMKQFNSRIISGEEYDRNYELIRLEDILKAIEDKKGEGKFAIGYGTVKFMFSSKLMFNWELGKDLDGQSTKTKQFLIDILT